MIIIINSFLGLGVLISRGEDMRLKVNFFLLFYCLLTLKAQGSFFFRGLIPKITPASLVRNFSSKPSIFWAEGLLGLSRGASELEVKQAFNAKALGEHPDVGGCEHSFRRLLAAREFLLNYVERPVSCRERSVPCDNQSIFDSFMADSKYQKWVWEQIQRSREP